MQERGEKGIKAENARSKAEENNEGGEMERDVVDSEREEECKRHKRATQPE